VSIKASGFTQAVILTAHWCYTLYCIISQWWHSSVVQHVCYWCQSYVDHRWWLDFRRWWKDKTTVPPGFTGHWLWLDHTDGTITGIRCDYIVPQKLFQDFNFKSNTSAFENREKMVKDLLRQCISFRNGTSSVDHITPFCSICHCRRPQQFRDYNSQEPGV